MAKGKYGRWLEPDGLTLLQGWARDGLTDEQLAKKMEISPSTLYEWKKRHPEISEALKVSKESADYKVESSLFRLAIGYVDAEGKWHPPNITAIIFWLKNRQPQKWREQRGATDMGNVEPEGPSPMQQLVKSLQDAARERKKGEEK
ncbi:helix-turn-helix domain-containing protein [Acidaminococcus sp.]|uniref:helix-turn-helix domain-containing protein n=1 Tax=Acidaminococcus sp. TaxID=1872103 RepID=UPI003D7DE6E5